MGLLQRNNAAAIAIAAKASKRDADVAYSLALKKAMGGITKASLGLGNVNNTTDANKPVSNATQTALNGKSNTVHTHAINDVTGLSSALNGLSDAAAAKLSIAAIATISTDAAATVTPSVTSSQVFHTGTLTANRTITLATAGMTTGSIIRFTRTGAGAFNLSIGGLKSLATNTWCDVIYNGSAWVMTAYGTL